MVPITAIRVFRTTESCDRTTFYVELTTQEGFTMTPSSFATGSIYTNGEGLSEEEARDRALIDANEWADFLQLTVTPFVQDGITYEPSMTLDTYSSRRQEAAQ